VAGEGPLAPRLRELADQEGLGERLRMLGTPSAAELREWFAAADLFVLPSERHETWGLVVNEAMNFALPVVVSDKVGCAADLVADGDNGFVVAAGQAGPLASAVRKLVESADLRQAMGRRSRERIDRWHYGLAAQGIVEACQAAAAAHRRRRL
jgi:glycosyltransferase involved in cell wall biosynthesis